MAAITLSISFQNATDKFTKSLTAQQRQEFAACSLDDVRQSIVNIQEKRGNQKIMRNMARIQAFLEAMDQYRKVVESFLNCTPFLGYVWVCIFCMNQFILEMLTLVTQGPIRFILLVGMPRTTCRSHKYESKPY